MRAALVVVVALGVLPLAAASGTFEVGPLVVVLENGHDAACIEEATGLCPASLRGEAPGDMVLDLDQRVALMGVGVNRTYVNEGVGHPLLPDGSVWLTPADHPIDHPIFRILIDVVGTRAAPAPLHDFSVIFSDEGMGATFLAPNGMEDETTPSQGRYWGQWGDEGAEDGLFERERIRPHQDFKNTSTDERVRDPDKSTACQVLADADCAAYADRGADVVQTNAPNVIVGGALVSVAAETDLSSLRPADPLGARDSTAAPGLARGATPPAPGRLASDPTGIAGLTAAGPTSEPSGLAPAPRATPEPAPPLRPASIAPQLVPDAPALPLLVVSAAAALALMLALLYSRILGRPGAIVRARRAEILALLSARGPTALREVSRELGIDRTTADYHARTLAKASMIRLARLRGCVVLALPDQDPTDHVRPPRATDHILALLRAQGGVVARDDIHRLAADIPHRTRNHAIRSLQRQGVVECAQGVGDVLVRIVTRA